MSKQKPLNDDPFEHTRMTQASGNPVSSPPASKTTLEETAVVRSPESPAVLTAPVFTEGNVNESPPADGKPKKVRRGLSAELQAMADIDKIMDDLDPLLHDLVATWFVGKFADDDDSDPVFRRRE